MDDDFVHVAPPNEVRISMSLSAAKEAVAYNETCSMHAMASLKVDAVEEDERAPMELIAVVDRSGSMAGQKLATVLKTLNFLVNKGLRKDDTFGIVTYDHNASTALMPTKMDKDGVAQARKAIASIVIGGTTNLSGGLIEGIEHLAAMPTVKGTMRAVLLFCDGQANVGIEKREDIVAAAKGAMGNQEIVVHTFGFGSDADTDTLQAIATSAGGAYYFVEDTEAIPLAFGDALGELSSVVAQNAKLTVFWYDSVPSLKVLSDYTTRAGKTVDGEDKSVVVELGDLYGEEVKDIVFEMSLGAETVADNDGMKSTPLSVRLDYFDVKEKDFRSRHVLLKVWRPEKTPEDQKVNLELDAAINRLRIAESMKKAAELADAGDLLAGTQVMRDAVAQAQRTPSSGMPLMQEMFSDVAALEEKYKDAASYRSLGAGATKSAAVAWHSQKSSTHAAGIYRGSSKGKARKEASETVLGKRGSDDDDDNDDDDDDDNDDNDDNDDDNRGCDTPDPIGRAEAPAPKRQMTEI